VSSMDDRLVRCISSVLPTLTDQEIRAVSIEQMADADSLSAVTLVALIDDEFSVDVDLEGLLACGTFQGILRYLRDSSMTTVAHQGLK
jgi:acyl carrier protein